MLGTIVAGFAKALVLADAQRPVARGRRGRGYQPGIGPHSEPSAISLILREFVAVPALSGAKWETGVPYPSGREHLDLLVDIDDASWAIEVTMARFSGDDGKPDDTVIKDLLSPYARDRSALTDMKKVQRFEGADHHVVLVYGFDDERRPLRDALDAIEETAQAKGHRLTRVTADFQDLVHPVFASGVVAGWEIDRRTRRRHFTVSAFVSYQGATLLHWHARNGMWLPPGGHIDADEDPVQAALREVREETGLTVVILPTAAAFDYASPPQLAAPATIMVEDIAGHPLDGPHQHIDSIYFTRPDPPRQTPRLGWHWVDAAGLRENRPPAAGADDPARQIPEDVRVLGLAAIERAAAEER